MNWQQDILGEFAGQGFSLHEDGDHSLEIYFKDSPKPFAVFSQLGPTKSKIQEACKQFMERLNGVGATKGEARI